MSMYKTYTNSTNKPEWKFKDNKIEIKIVLKILKYK